jgi:DNA polymerase-3 subunit epsilon
MFLFRRRHLPDFVKAYAAGPWPDQRLPWRDVRFVVLDVETSGLEARRDALLAVGLLEVEAGRARLDRTWSSLIRPPDELLVGGESIRIHRLTRAALSEAPPMEEVLPALLERLRGRALVVHVAQIDVGFLNRALGERYGARLQGPILDTARIALRLHQDAQILGEASHGAPAPSVQLQALAERYGLPVYPQHNALSDALSTAQVFLAQATRLEQQGGKTLRALLRAGGV